MNVATAKGNLTKAQNAYDAAVEAAAALEVNKTKKLYCEECCMHFTIQEDGRWMKSRPKGAEGMYADLVADSFLQCTCGNNLAVKVQKATVIGEFLSLK